MNFITAIIDSLVGFVQRNPLTTLLIVILALGAPALLKGIALFIMYFFMGLVILAVVIMLAFRWRIYKAAIYRRRIVFEMEALGVNSIGLTAIISVFIGAVITLQMCINLDSPFIPRSLVGYATRETMILEFSSAVVALILAGKVGSSIASEIGTMRITEQIDALEIMGVNSASYLILPKIVAAMLFFPFLTILSILIGILGGWIIAAATGIMIPADYVDGLLMDFKPYSITYTLIKTVVFAYIITSISAFYGYNARGNSLEVGAASTRAVVASCVVVLLFDLILTQVLLI